jgi:hypothetical protein
MKLPSQLLKKAGSSGRISGGSLVERSFINLPPILSIKVRDPNLGLALKSDGLNQEHWYGIQ